MLKMWITYIINKKKKQDKANWYKNIKSAFILENPIKIHHKILYLNSVVGESNFDFFLKTMCWSITKKDGNATNSQPIRRVVLSFAFMRVFFLKYNGVLDSKRI